MATTTKAKTPVPIDYATTILDAVTNVALGKIKSKSDKTEICEVFSVIDEGESGKREGKYRVYNGAIYYEVYTGKDSGMTFKKGDYVYVNIPQSSYKAKKMITSEYAVEDATKFQPFEDYDMKEVEGLEAKVEDVIVKEEKNAEGELDETKSTIIKSLNSKELSLSIEKTRSSSDSNKSPYTAKQCLVYEIPEEALKDQKFLGISFKILTGFGGTKGTFEITVKFLKSVSDTGDLEEDYPTYNDIDLYSKTFNQQSIYGNPYLIRTAKEFQFMITTKQVSKTIEEETKIYGIPDIDKCVIIVTTYPGFDYPGTEPLPLIFSDFKMYVADKLTEKAFEDTLEKKDVEKAILIQTFSDKAMETIKPEDYEDTTKYMEALTKKTQELYDTYCEEQKEK